ncbi:MAG: tRNA 2-thiocytidine(32) synthetase TtcA [Gammaproteobacteria bacterium]|nr:tRNA 2-thiocytidine(32) synthetase TtcA [Gammaproteobacteria bacterium]
MDSVYGYVARSPGDIHPAGIVYSGVLEKVTALTKLFTHPHITKAHKSIRSQVGRAISDYNMIEDGDLVMACLSGGADSYTMLDMLLGLRQAAPIRFDIVAVNLDQKQPGFPQQVLPDYLENLGVEYRVVEEDTFSVVQNIIPQGKTTCSLCSRLRRGILYNTAQQLGASKIALGHHADDIVETLFLNMFYNARLKSMPPKLISDDKRNIVIRPLANVRELSIKAYADLRKFPIIPCNLCGSQGNSQRQAVKAMLQKWDKTNPGRVQSIFNSLTRVTTSHLLDTNLFDFAGLSIEGLDDKEKPGLASDVRIT